MKDFYVYAWRRPDTNEIFYIGKGSNNRDLKPKRNTHFVNVIAKLRRIGVQPTVTRIAENLSETVAFEVERQEIAKFGRRDLGAGPLVNMTDGGEGASGWVPTEEWRTARSVAQTGRRLSSAAKLKLREANLGKSHTAEARAKMSASHTGKDCSPETVATLLRSNLGKKHDLSRRESNAEAQRRKLPSGKYKGVSFHADTNKWRAQITIARRQKHLGLHVREEDAARAYDAAAIAAWGVGNCYLNFPSSVIEDGAA